MDTNNNFYFEIIANNTIIAKSRFEKTVDLFCAVDFKKLTSIETTIDFGGVRLAISVDSTILFTCNFYGGLSAFKIDDGQILWENSKIKSIQKIDVSDDGAFLFIVTEKRFFLIVDIKSGEVINQEKRILSFFKLTENNVLFINSNKSAILKSDFKISPFYKFENRIINVCLIKNNIICSEMNKPLKMISIETGGKIWESELSLDYRINYLKQTSEEVISMVGFCSNGKIDESYLFHLDIESGNILKKTQLDSSYHSFCFSPDGLKLYCSNIDVYDTINHLKIFPVNS